MKLGMWPAYNLQILDPDSFACLLSSNATIWKGIIDFIDTDSLTHRVLLLYHKKHLIFTRNICFKKLLLLFLLLLVLW